MLRKTMRTNNSRVAAFLAVLFVADGAAAGVITTHSWGHAWGWSYSEETTAPTSLNLSYSGTSLDGSAGTTTQAITNPSADSLMRLEATAWSAGSEAKSDAFASWIDIVYLTGAVPLPSSIRVELEVTGKLSASRSRSSGFAQTDFGFGLYGLYSVDDNGWPSPDFSSGVNVGSQPLIVRSDTPSSLERTVRFTLAHDLDYDAELGGYGWTLRGSLVSRASNGGRASADFGDTVKLIFVTNADGSPLVGYSLSFDSGLQSHPTVPEPGSLALLGLGGLGLAVDRCRKRQRELPAA